MKIRRAVNEDAKAISKLIRSVAYSFTVNADGRGAEEFLEAIEPQAVRKYIESAEYKYFAGVIEDEIVGVAAIRQERHLFHLFVAEHH